MYEFLRSIVNFQISLTVVFFLLGVLCAFLMSRRSGSRKWKVADLVWVAVGGSAAISAVVATLYLSRLDTLLRRVNAIGSVASYIIHETDLFAAKYCSKANLSFSPWQSDIQSICRQNMQISISIRKNSELPLFSEISGIFPAGTNATFFDWNYKDGGSPVFDRFIFRQSNPPIYTYEDSLDHEKLRSIIESYGSSSALDSRPSPAEVGIIDPLDGATILSLNNLSNAGLFVELVAEYRTTGTLYNSIAENLVQANLDWTVLQSRYIFLAVRVISIVLVAFVFPLRIAKSWYELREEKLRTAPAES